MAAPNPKTPPQHRRRGLPSVPRTSTRQTADAGRLSAAPGQVGRRVTPITRRATATSDVSTMAQWQPRPPELAVDPTHELTGRVEMNPCTLHVLRTVAAACWPAMHRSRSDWRASSATSALSGRSSNASTTVSCHDTKFDHGGHSAERARASARRLDAELRPNRALTPRLSWPGR